MRSLRLKRINRKVRRETAKNTEKKGNEKESNEERTENCGEIPRYTRDDNSSPLTNDLQLVAKEMTKKIAHNITTAILGILLVLLTVAQASAQIVVEECDTFTFSVDSREYIHDTRFVWGIYEASNQPVDVLDPNTTLDPDLYFVDGLYASGIGKTVKVHGLPVGKYYVRIHVWNEEDCTDNVEMYVMEVIESTIEMDISADSVCIGEATNVYIRFTGVGPFDIYYTVGDQETPSVVNLTGKVKNPEITIPITQALPVGETKFWVMKVTDDCKVYSYEEVAPEERPGTGILIYPKPVKQPIYLKDD